MRASQKIIEAYTESQRLYEWDAHLVEICPPEFIEFFYPEHTKYTHDLIMQAYSMVKPAPQSGVYNLLFETNLPYKDHPNILNSYGTPEQTPSNVLVHQIVINSGLDTELNQIQARCEVLIKRGDYLPDAYLALMDIAFKREDYTGAEKHLELAKKHGGIFRRTLHFAENELKLHKAKLLFKGKPHLTYEEVLSMTQKP